MTRCRTAAATIAALLLVVPGCGDDDAGDDGAGVTTPAVEADSGDDGTDEDPPGDDTTTTSSVPDAEAEDPPGGGEGDEEGASDDFVYVAELTGDAGGSGRAELQAGNPGELCVDMVAIALGSAPTGAHVHESQDGEAVVPIGEPTTVDGDTATWNDVCVVVDDAVAEALAVDATRFHVDVHTADHPDGAVRGQLDFATIFDLELS